MGNLPENSRTSERKSVQRGNPGTLFSSKSAGKWISCKIILCDGGTF